MARFDGAHPAVLAEKYNRSYRPYLLGQSGAAFAKPVFWNATDVATTGE